MTAMQPGVPTLVAQTSVPVRRILGLNPSAMTGPGTNSYLIGASRLCLLDPGPRDDVQFENFMAAIGDAKLEYILATHTHGDHSPGALKLQEATGATLVGLAAPDSYGQDRSFQPSQQWHHGDIIETDEYSIELIHTPGHVSNHICYLLREDQLLFTGDHVLQGTTSVILPPDGDMEDYLNSLYHLQSLDLRFFAPGHGLIMDDPQTELSKLIAHRLKREQKILTVLEQIGSGDVDRIVLSAYDDVAEHLIPWAKKTLLAHLIKLRRDGDVLCVDDVWQISPA